jgi:co-chaperonin GroES (HSP10)
MHARVKPLGKDILIKVLNPEEQESKTSGGLYIPEEANPFAGKLYKAEVLKVGGDVDKICSGDIILCKYQTGIEVDYDVIIMKEEEVIGRF